MSKFQKLGLVIMIILIVIILITLLIFRLNENMENKNLFIEDDFGDGPTEKVLEKNDNGFVKIDDTNMFFTVLNIFNNYIDVIKYDINEDDTIDENPYQMKNEDDRKIVLFSMLDSNYKINNNIESENDIVVKKKLSSASSVIPIEMKVKYSDRIQIYALDVYIEDENQKQLNEEFYIVKIDNKNSSFSIKPLENCESIDEIYENDDLEDIQVNDYNKYFIETMNDEALAKIYMQRYKYMIVNYPQILYDNYFEEEYKLKRFESFENFENYIQENAEEILNIMAMKYTKESYNDYSEFIIVDQYENLYIFKENSIMNFTLKLDTYTITPDVFVNEYAKASEEKRVQMNIDKFIQMINRHDYNTSYNCISEGFRNNYFANQEQFENYIKNNFFSYNKFEFKNIEKKGNNLYVCTVQLTDLLEESTDVKEINIIMQLNDNLDFEMSFGM